MYKYKISIKSPDSDVKQLAQHIVDCVICFCWHHMAYEHFASGMGSQLELRGDATL